MKNRVIFCVSYGEIKRSLYLATQNQSSGQVSIVIPGESDIYRFFQAVNEKVLNNSLKLIFFERYPSRRVSETGLKSVFQVVPDIINERRYLKEIYSKHFAEMKDNEIFFCSRGFSGYVFYLIKKLSQKNRIVNTATSPPNIPNFNYYFPHSIRELVSLVIYKLIFGFDITLGQLPHLHGFCFMTDRFLNKTVEEFISWEQIEHMTNGFDYSRFKVFDPGKYSVIYFDDNLLDAGYLESKEVYKNELSAIFDIIRKYFPEEKIARKYHPGYPGDKTLVSVGDVLPDFIPAELLYDEKIKMYVSLLSYSLTNVESGLAVSIADLISFKYEQGKNQLKSNMLEMKKSDILFPQTLDEFEKIVIRSANQT